MFKTEFQDLKNCLVTLPFIWALNRQCYQKDNFSLPVIETVDATLETPTSKLL